MASEFKVNEDGLTREGYKPLHPKMKKVMRVTTLIYLIVSVIILALVQIFSVNLGGFYWPSLIIILFIIVYYIVSILIIPIIYYARYRYNVGNDRIDVLRGVFIIRHIIVPIERIHQVEVTRGPIKNIFGLANVSMTTAGGIASIEYLELSEAEKIADMLNDRVVSILKERETN
ncbi:MAG: Bacterial membrane flanked domain protein [Methanomassiliicoccales archaeon PtaU1.Bin124]|nr:MAG: Bacterial membrane flanked domain protein [Methanomassiliicoccales archaeon PtaU1.Bin124]